mmetsp:Transcript_107212/g.301724  ORF Transcript_107212/g.301724 Transcript_107212/m.301724 type:complete len:566 (+) Transcript_107212:92-1789(+)
MAAFWQILRNEVKATVDDIRDKGAIGAFQDAALDTRDLAASTGGWLWNGVRNLVAEGGRPVIQASGGVPPVPGATARVMFPDGNVVDATVLEVNADAKPPYARVAAPGSGEVFMVEIVDPTAAAATVGNEGGEESLLGGLKQELHATVQDFREKGAVGTMRDATLDAVDIVRNLGGSAVSGARSLADPLLERGRGPGTADDAQAAGGGGEKSFLGGIQPALHATLKEVREKGAVAAMRGASSDVVDLVGSLRGPAAPTRDDANGAPTSADAGSASTEDAPLMSFSGLRQELQATVQDFREKGAVGAMRDATLDAMDIVKDTATSGMGGARSLAGSIFGATQRLPAQEVDGLDNSASGKSKATTSTAPAPAQSSSSTLPSHVRTAPEVAAPEESQMTLLQRRSDDNVKAMDPAAAMPLAETEVSAPDAGAAAPASTPAPAETEASAPVAGAAAPTSTPAPAAAPAVPTSHATSASAPEAPAAETQQKPASTSCDNASPTPQVAASVLPKPTASAAASTAHRAAPPPAPVGASRPSVDGERKSRQSLVSMRRKMFESAKQETEEIID